MSARLSERARGRWLDILTALKLPSLALTGKHGPCPMCGGKDRWRWCDRNGSGDWICNNCGHGSGTDLVMKFHKVDFKEAAQMIEGVIGEAHKREKPRVDPAQARGEMARLWAASKPIIADCPAGRYLVSRSLRFDASSALRWASSATFPMMIGKVISPDNRAVNLHRTFLDANGRKAPIENCKLLMKGETPNGSAIRLLAPSNGRLGVAEGIETALSAAVLFDIPCWATVHSAGMAAFTPPDGVTELHIFGDNDPSYAGHAAAYTLAKRMVAAQIVVSVAFPDSVGEDWNDVLRNRGREGPEPAIDGGFRT